VETNPDFNWMGVLIGPRGSTQKRLEADSGCKVLIRGKGAQRQDDSRFDHETAQEPLHVLIVGKNEADAKRGEQLVRDILFDPQIAMNLKRQQLGGHVMNNMSNGGAGGLRPDQDPHPIELNVPDNVVGFIIGHRGENIRKIQME
jgi:far upstream element-binding protein